MKARKLELRSVGVGEKEPLTYAGLVKTVVSTPGAAGLSCDEMILAVQLLNALESADLKEEGYLLLSEEHYRFLKTRLEVFRWGTAHRVFADFIEHVRNLPLVEVGATECART